ncbi:MAG: lysophospholipase [Caulobacterales bacterium]|nr:lysophospholipase [Caulobacterales bacterium]
MDGADTPSDPFDIAPLASPTGAELALRHRPAPGAAIGVVQINHGAAEHAGRYRALADRLADSGFHVYAHDHRGHGATRVPGLAPHVLGPNGWDALIDDITAVHGHIAGAHPDLPRIVLGHSMGSVAALEFALRRPDEPAGLALLGPTLGRIAALPFLRLLLAVEALIRRPEAASPLFQALAWTPLNRPFAPARTPYDWLSRDEAEVDAYVADPACGWPPTVNFARQIARGVAATYDDRRMHGLRAGMPVLLMSGGQDSSTRFGATVGEVEGRLRRAGLTDVEPHVFPGMRHELHNEVDRDRAVDTLIAWCRRAAGA